MKYEVRCSNNECSICGIQFAPSHYTLKYDSKAGRMMPQFTGVADVCPECGGELEFVEVQGKIAEFSVSTFNGLPQEAKQAVLRKRFDADTKRGGADVKRENHRKAIEKMVGYDKA